MISSFSELIRNNIYLKLLEIKNEVKEIIIRRKKMYDFDDIQEKCFESIKVKNAENIIIDKEIEKIRKEIIGQFKSEVRKVS